jgi:DNA-binding LacI/PurR family transcriptional regulator
MASARKSPRVSLRDVARAVGISHVAVSLALRGSERISVERRTQVQRAAEALGYRPDPMLAALAAYRRGRNDAPIAATLAWLNQWPDPRALRRWGEFELFWRGALQTAATLGYRLEEFVLGRDGRALERQLVARGVCGLLLPPHRNALELNHFDWARRAVVKLGLSLREPTAHVVVSDQTEGAALAFRRAWELGYRRIGFVTSERFEHNTRGNFRAGFLRQQSELLARATRLEPLVLPDEHASAPIGPLRTWLRLARPDAVISSVAGLRGMLSRIGVIVPRDLAVAGTSALDGNFSAGLNQQCEEIGAVAVRTLAGMIQQGHTGGNQTVLRVLVEPVWVDGDSLPPKKAPLASRRRGGKSRAFA